MKKWFLAGVMCCAGFLALYAADMQNAEEMYRSGKFAAALGEYENLLQTYPNDPHLYYNIGNCYFKMGSLGLAVANYYRAFRLAPGDKDIRHNLSMSLQNSGERLVPAGMPEIMHRTFFSLRLNEVKGLFLLGLWLFCMLGCIWLLKRRFGRAALTVLAVVLVLAAWYGWRFKIEKTPLAVVASPIAELRSGPGNNFPASANVGQGHLLIVQDAKDNWYDVIVKSQGLQGWIEERAIEKI